MTMPPGKRVAVMGERLIKKLCNSMCHIWKAVNFWNGGSINYRTKESLENMKLPGAIQTC